MLPLAAQHLVRKNAPPIEDACPGARPHGGEFGPFSTHTHTLTQSVLLFESLANDAFPLSHLQK